MRNEMKIMKKAVASFLVLFASCAAAADIQDASPFVRVFDVISAKDVLSKNSGSLFKYLAGLCVYKEPSGAEKYSQGNVQCGSDADIKKMTVSGTADPNIFSVSAVIYGKEKCAYMRQVLTKNFGRPRKGKSDCDMEWAAKGSKGHGRTLVAMELSKEENQIYFSINEEENSEP